jgi:uncharacterized coiled-coil DUF342 family protein
MDIAKRSLRLFFTAQLIAFALSVHAEPAESPSLTPEQMQELQELQQKMHAVGQQLNEIRQKTLEAKPELQKQQDEYRSLLFKTMKGQGSDPDPTLARMREIEEQVQDQELAEDKRKQLIMEYQEKDAQLQQAGHDAIQDEGVHKAAEKLSQATIAAMREQNPKTEELLQEMEQVRKEMQQILAKTKAGAAPGGK